MTYCVPHTAVFRGAAGPLFGLRIGTAPDVGPSPTVWIDEDHLCVLWQACIERVAAERRWGLVTLQHAWCGFQAWCISVIANVWWPIKGAQVLAAKPRPLSDWDASTPGSQVSKTAGPRPNARN